MVDRGNVWSPSPFIVGIIACTIAFISPTFPHVIWPRSLCSFHSALLIPPPPNSQAGLHDVEGLLEKKKQEEGKPPGPLVDEPSKLSK